jgi:DNA polymerase V
MMQSIDYINQRMGRDKVHLAVQGRQKRWKLKQEKRSPSYSTSIKEALEVIL